MVFENKNIQFLKNKFPGLNAGESSIHSYTTINEEYELLKHGVGIRIVHAGVIMLMGKDVLDFIHRISTNDLRNLQINQKKVTLFTNEKGRIIDRTVLVRYQDYNLLIGSLSENYKLSRWIERFIIMEDVKLHNVSSDYLTIELYGPQAEAFMIMLCGKCIDNIDFQKVVDIDLEAVHLKTMIIAETNEVNKYLLLIKKDKFEIVIENFLNQNSVFDYGFVGEDAFSLFRIEQGIPVAPNEINDNFNPHEINVIGDVSFSKGCYIGQEVIARLDTYDKVQRELKQFIFHNGYAVSECPKSIMNELKEEVGIITSLSKNQNNDSTVALGLIRKKYGEGIKNGKLYIDGNPVEFELKDIGK